MSVAEKYIEKEKAFKKAWGEIENKLWAAKSLEANQFYAVTTPHGILTPVLSIGSVRQKFKEVFMSGRPCSVEIIEAKVVNHGT